MILLAIVLSLNGIDDEVPVPAFLQQETGVPMAPFSGVEAGVVRGRFPHSWGLKDDEPSGQFGAVNVGGLALDNGIELMLRFSYRHWDELDLRQQNGDVVPDPDGLDAEARVRAGMVDIAIDAGVGPLRIGALVGGGLYLFKHRYERELSPALEAGVYVRLKPLRWIYVEGAATAGGIRSDFNRTNNHTDGFLSGHAAAGIDIEF